LKLTQDWGKNNVRNHMYCQIKGCD